MQRRELLRVLGAAATLPMLGALTIEELLAAGSALHARRDRYAPIRFLALTPHEGATVTAIAEAIIPATDTPGATGAGVPQFIDLIVGEWYTDAERGAFRAGLREVDARSRAAHGADFVETDARARAGVLRMMEAEAIGLKDADPPPDPPPFFATMKHLTLWGYYTSEVGAMEELAYETIPGQFNGCAPIPSRDRRGSHDH